MGWGSGNLGGGSAGLNFKIVGGTSKPSNPKENTIWVNTEAEITGYEFVAEQPAESYDGLVWIQTGASSTVSFNALKKNAIQVYPLSAKQCVSGAWTDVTTKSYQGGEWVDWWDGELYVRGDQYTGVTGGWVTNKETNGTVTYNDTSITVNLAKNTNGATFTGPKNAIDLTNYNTIAINVTNFYMASNSSMQLYIREDTVVDANPPIVGISLNKTGTLTADISALSGKYYIAVGCGWFNPCSVTFNEVRLYE